MSLVGGRSIVNTRAAAPRPAANLNFNATVNNQGLNATGSVSGVKILGPIKGNGSVTVNKQWGRPATVSTTTGWGFR